MKRLSDGEGEPEHKRSSNGSNTVDADGPITLEDVEHFQKEAIWRRMNHYKRECDALRTQLHALEASDDGETVRRELEDLTQKWLAASKQAERLESASVARCYREGRASGNGTKAEKGSGGAENASKEIKSENTDETMTKQLAEVKTELAGLQAAVDTTQKQLAEEVEKATRVQERLREAESQIIALPASAKAQEARLAELESDNARLAQQAHTAHELADSLRMGQAGYEQQVRDKFDTKRQELERNLAQSEADVARIRAARDDRISELNVAKATSAEQLRELEVLRKALEEPIAVTSQSNGRVQDVSEGDLTVESIDGDEASLKERIVKLTRQNKALAAEISGLEQAVVKTTQKTREATKGQVAAEQKLGLAVAAKTKADEKYFGAMRARDAQALEVTKLRQALVKSSEVAAELRATEKSLTAQISRLQKQVVDHDDLARAADRRSAAADRSRLDTAARLAGIEKALEHAKDQLSQRDLAVRNAESARRHAEIAAEKVRRQLETQRAISGVGSSGEIQEQLESLRSIALCSVCQKNWKDTALTVCGHVLCADCVKSRLAARMRKCPMCNCQFQQADVLTVHL